MRIHLSGASGCGVLLLVLFVPAILTSYFLHSVVWLIVIPPGIVVLGLLVAALPLKRKVTAEQFASELEEHLLGTEGAWDWDDTTSVRIADERLERLRWYLPKFNSLSLEKDKEELKAIIAALRRNEVPDVFPPPKGGHRIGRFIHLNLKN
jgi:hypothetical protein